MSGPVVIDATEIPENETKIGGYNRLRVIRLVEFGVYLDGVDLVDILLPRRYVPADCKIDDELDVFVYVDSEDRLVATTDKPKVQVGECASLKVVAVNAVGAFLDWGLPKDLLVPFSEQFKRMEVGKYYTVYVFCDEETGRIAASSKLGKFLQESTDALEPRQAVDLLVAAKTDLGYKCVIDNSYLGMIFHSDVLQPLRLGQKLQGFIKAVREDGKIDLCLQLQDQATRDALADKIILHLRNNNGISPITDKSTPEAIHRQYGVSKASYKKAIGNLFRQQAIVIEPERIVLVEAGAK
jgi:predicted RNA-binding protein (virulence factor B family)